MDVVGNVHGRLKAVDPKAPAMLMGSHYDTVIDAGRFDGPLGILVAIAAVKALHVEVSWIVCQTAGFMGFRDKLVPSWGLPGLSWHVSGTSEPWESVPLSRLCRLLCAEHVGDADADGKACASPSINLQHSHGHHHLLLQALEGSPRLSPALHAQMQHGSCNLSTLLPIGLPPVLRTPLEVIAFADEEGVRCPPQAFRV